MKPRLQPRSGLVVGEVTIIALARIDEAGVRDIDRDQFAG